jgi:hypothetical protein
MGITGSTVIPSNSRMRIHQCYTIHVHAAAEVHSCLRRTAAAHADMCAVTLARCTSKQARVSCCLPTKGKSCIRLHSVQFATRQYN